MKLMFVSLGCDKNLVDTEMMLGQLSLEGFSFTDDENDADVIVVNTCSFISDAKKESIETLINMGQLKKKGKLKALIATGCLAQRYSDEIKNLIPEVDQIVGTMSIDKIVLAVNNALEGKFEVIKDSLEAPLVYGKKRLVTTGGHYAYLKIAEGCEKHCTYCAIPSFRGRYKSVPMEVLVEEARTLCEGGVKELILVAQETTLYGIDLYGKKSLPELLKRLSEINELYYIRILYCYPEEIDDEFIEAIKTNKKVVKYLDMPIQHASDNMLKKMGRKTTRESLERTIGKLRSEIPDIALRTTLITGFPGEKESDFKEMLSFVESMRFDRLGVFTYSKEDGTAAEKMSGHKFECIKKIRRNKVMKLQQTIAFEMAEKMVGKELLVMVEGKMPEENAYVTRTYKDAPNVDGYLFLETGKELMTGDLIKVKVTGSDKYDLVGVPIDEFAE
ncbi:MAG: 30S ribosomal protein S12 methylthiotransferase RimO [Lachnospiraceae bacterium]|nr:30S ribosomal protein S12 methylthiotransferase RimO [Lachnospiraceae bacterium]